MIRHRWFMFSLLTTLAMTAASIAAQNPCNPCGGKQAANLCNPCGGKIAVNPCHAKHGTVFYVADPMHRNTVSFTSRAPLEDMVGTTNMITGYFVFDPAQPTNGVRGSFTVPVASLDTGIPLRDEHLRSEAWLDAGAYDKITFVVEDTADIVPVKATDTYQTFDVTLIGPFTMHGQTSRMRIPARVTFLRENEQTQQKMPGDLLGVRASFESPAGKVDRPSSREPARAAIPSWVSSSASMLSPSAIRRRF